MAATALVWVHRLHAKHPEVPIGMQYVPVNVAKFLISEECAQGWQVDQRHLIKPDPSAPPKGAPASRTRRKVETPEEPEAAETLPEEPEAPPSESTPRRRYKRRDIRPEE